MRVSSVSGLFLSILLLGAHSEKPSLSVLSFGGAVLPAVVFHRKESVNVKTFECLWTLP